MAWVIASALTGKTCQEVQISSSSGGSASCSFTGVSGTPTTVATVARQSLVARSGTKSARETDVVMFGIGGIYENSDGERSPSGSVN